jgi:hypothetical protein
VRAHRVTGGAPGTPVRITGWTAGRDARAEILPAVGLTEELTGALTATGLFAALVRLTADPDPAPLPGTVTVRADGADGLAVTWSGPGTTTRVRFCGGDEVRGDGTGTDEGVEVS